MRCFADSIGVVVDRKTACILFVSLGVDFRLPRWIGQLRFGAATEGGQGFGFVLRGKLVDVILIAETERGQGEFKDAAFAVAEFDFRAHAADHLPREGGGEQSNCQSIKIRRK